MNSSKAITIVLMLTSILTFAQENQKTSYLGINLGVSFPKDDYGSKEFKDESGYALAGILIDLESAFMFHKNFGFGGKLGFFANAMDVETGKKNLGLSDEANLKATNWNNRYLMFGPQFVLTSRKVFFDFKVQGGLLNSSTPEITYNIPPFGTATQSSAKATTLAYGFGFGTRINVSEKVALHSKLDLIYGNQNFKFKQLDGTIQSTNILISTVNFGVGLCYLFVDKNK
ncbi:MAG: outer membrane beta-barrel protein [Cytophagales bacterium]